MNLELRKDVEEWVSEKTRFYQETLYQYFLRIHNFTGVDEFGNALEVIPIEAMITPSLNHNLLPQAVGYAARLQEVFENQGICEMDSQSTQISTSGKPYVKDGKLYNAFSLPTSEMLQIFGNQLNGVKSAESKVIICIGGDASFFYEDRPYDVIYKPRKNSLPYKILMTLRANYTKKPLSGGGLVRSIASPKMVTAQDVTPKIRDINKYFKKNSGFLHDIIINRSGYLLNDREYQLVLK